MSYLEAGGHVLAGLFASYSFYGLLRDRELADKALRYLMTFGPVRRALDSQMDKELGKMLPGLINDRFKHVELPEGEGFDRRIVLPEDGDSDENIMDRLQVVSNCKKDDSKISGAIYANEEDWSDFVGRIYSQTAWLNPTHTSVWPELTQLEAEIYAMCSEMFGLPGNGNGVLTSGGTMSNMQAMYAYRNKAYVERYITRPNVVAPRTAHTSFKKACEILKIEYRMCDVNDVNECDVRSMSKLIDSNTICLIGSAPSFPYGIIDPLKKIADLAEEWNICFHIDCCLGGFQYPFLNMPNKVDFSDPRVTTISMDPHKFAQTPKGISVLLFRDANIKKYLTFVDLKWDGGVYVMEGFPGSRPGANVCILWAMMRKMGKAGYRESAERLFAFREELQSKIREEFSGQLYVHGNPQLSTLGIKSDKYNIHFVNKVMCKYGWEFNELPDGLHFCLTEKHYRKKDTFIESFISDLRNSLNYIDGHPTEDPGDMAKIYCTTQEIPNFAGSILDEVGRAYITIQNMVKPPSDEASAPKGKTAKTVNSSLCSQNNETGTVQGGLRNE